MKLQIFNELLLKTNNQSENFVKCLHLYHVNYSKFYNFLSYIRNEKGINFTLIPTLEYKKDTTNKLDKLEEIQLFIDKNNLPILNECISSFNLQLEFKDNICHLYL